MPGRTAYASEYSPSFLPAANTTADEHRPPVADHAPIAIERRPMTASTSGARPIEKTVSQ